MSRREAVTSSLAPSGAMLSVVRKGLLLRIVRPGGTTRAGAETGEMPESESNTLKSGEPSSCLLWLRPWLAVSVRFSLRLPVYLRICTSAPIGVTPS
jgi:hypothetical protein